jgi:pimeloyl-ACP methyl ester carboxylesterase
VTVRQHGQVSAHSEALPAPAPVEFVSTSVGEIAVRRTPVRGPGPHEPAVLVHGLGGNSLNWVDLGASLADRLECVSPDLPGFGATEPLASADYSIAAHTAAVVATIEALFPGQSVHLFGNSMGGAVALQVAARRPDLVRTLCLISPALPDLRPHLSNMHIPVMAMPRVGTVLFNRYQKVEAHQRVKATFDLCFADPSRLHPQRRAEAEEEARRRDELPWIRDAFVGSTQSLLATYLDRGPERPWALAGWVEAPTLLVYGRKDKLVDPKAAHRATKEFSVAHVMVIPDSGHVAQMEHPELVDRWWREWLG